MYVLARGCARETTCAKLMIVMVDGRGQCTRERCVVRVVVTLTYNSRLVDGGVVLPY